MGLASARTRANPKDENVPSFRVADVIVIDPNFGLGLGGIVLVLDNFRPIEPKSLVGQAVTIRLPGDWTLSGEIAGVRDHGATSSILLANWPDGFPRPSVGWQVAFPNIDTIACESGPPEYSTRGAKS